MLDTDVITEISHGLIEDPTFSTGLWTIPEILTYGNLRQYRFLKETRLLAAWAIVPWVTGQPEAYLPTDWIDMVVARWHSFVDNRWTPVAATDSFELDHMSPETALTVNPPLGYRDSDLETLRIVLGPVPIAPGELEILYVALTVAIDGTGVPFEVPDAFAPYIKYGIYADMLSKDGRGQDLLRARYCEQRYQEGIALAQSLLLGWA